MIYQIINACKTLLYDFKQYYTLMIKAVLCTQIKMIAFKLKQTALKA